MDFETASLEELRNAIVATDPPTRVFAAFELARRLGKESAPELALDHEEHAGVRTHWLTILASFGERDAVAAVAEERGSTAEGAHAIHLAAQMGIGDSDWLARRFNDAPERCRVALVAQDRGIDWVVARPGLENLLQSNDAAARTGAARKLFAASGLASSLKSYATTHPLESRAWFEAWANGNDHHELLQLLATDGVTEVALEALRHAQRTFPLPRIREVVLEVPAAIGLVSPLGRDELIGLTDAATLRDRWVPEEWWQALREGAPAPFSKGEADIVRRWAMAALHDEAWDWEGPPTSGAALAAMGCAVQALNSELLLGASEALIAELDKGSTERLGTALDYLLSGVRTERGQRPLAELDGVVVLDVVDGNPRGYAWLVSNQLVLPWRMSRENGIVHVRLGDHTSYTKVALDRLWRKGRFPTALSQWEFFLGEEGAILVPFGNDVGATEST